MSTAKRVVKNTAYLYVRMLVSILANIFTTRILLDALGASDYGLYNVVGGAIMMLGFLTATMSHTTQRFLNYAEGQGDIEGIKNVFNNSLIVHYAVAALFVIILSVAGLIFFNGVLNIPDGRDTAALMVYGCLIFSTAFSVTIVPYDSVLNAHENMLVYSVIGIFDVVFKLVIAIIVLFAETDKLILYAILMALESWFVRWLTKSYCRRKYIECRSEELNKYYSKSTIRRISAFAGWNLVNIASGMTSQFGKNVVVNHFFGTILNASLGIATQLSGVIMGVSANMIKAITPILVKSEASNQREKMLEITYVGCRFSFLLFSFFCLPIYFFIDEILTLWLKEIPDGTVIFCKLIIIATLIEQAVSFLYQAIAAQGNIKYYNITKGVVNIMPIVSTIIMFMMRFEAYWAIVNWIIWYSIGGGIVNVYFAKRNVLMSLSEYLNKVLKPCFVVTTFSVLINEIIIYISDIVDMQWFFYLLISIAISMPIYYFLGLNHIERDNLIHKIGIYV